MFKLFYENTNLVVHFNNKEELWGVSNNEGELWVVSKVCSVRNRVFLLAQGDLLFGDFDPLELETATCTLGLSLIRRGVIDVDCDADMLYVVDESGRVFQTKATQSPSGLAENWKELQICSERTCIHGKKNSTERVQIKHVTCNNDGVLFTTRFGELYAIGDFSEILTSDIPMRIECFRGLHVIQVSAGNNFVVVLTQKRPISCDYGQQHIVAKRSFALPSSASATAANEDALSLPVSDPNDAFINYECPKCVPEIDPNYLNPRLYHDIHPKITDCSKSTTEDTSVASSPCPSDNTFEEDAPCKVPPSSTPLKAHKESAMNFLLDLSHSGKDYIGHTTMLTENVTKNITSMVKTLSRHMSGSDNNDNMASIDGEAASTEASVALDNSNEGHGQLGDDSQSTLISTEISRQAPTHLEESSTCVEADVSETSNSFQDPLESIMDVQSAECCETENRISKLCRLGSNHINTDVWCFGSVNRGHLGTGDHIKRTRINSVLPLSGQGITKIKCGKEHTAALTLDGRLFVWGCNSRNQISPESTDSFSAPRLIRSSQPIFDMACGHGQTVILTNDLRVVEQSHWSDSSQLEGEQLRSTLPVLEVIDGGTSGHCHINNGSPPILASDGFTVHNQGYFMRDMAQYLTSEQRFLKEVLTNFKIIRPIMKKLAAVKHGPALNQLCLQYQKLIHAVAVNVSSLRRFYSQRSSCWDLTFLQSHNELITLYRTYIRKYCDVFCVHGFKYLQQLEAAANRTDFGKIFETPLKQMTCVDLIDRLVALEQEESIKGLLLDRRRDWGKFENEKIAMIEEARLTIHFYDQHSKSPTIPMLQQPERRLVLDSRQVSLKAMKGSPWLVLFSDLLCNLQSSGSMIPLETLWASPIADTVQRKYAFKIVTPLETTILMAQSHGDKMKWLGALEHCIKRALKRPATSQSKVPQFRNASFMFPNDYPKYGGAKYFGRWHFGKMHGIGHIVFPDGRVYNGQMSGNEINGFGRMYTPRIGIYEGDFEQGKYHGYGLLELQNKTMYEGNFQKGKYNGHGMLMSADSTYIGEFVDNQRHGYGVLDENVTGIKYMGQFVENKKQGRGICITMEGDYFEGQFSQDQLNGRGVASFEAQDHDCYYEGEMSLQGPTGKGVLYMAAKPEVDASGNDWREGRAPQTVRGNLLQGVLGGVWQNIKIVNGKIAMGQEFTKYSSLFGKLAIECDKKWQSLFNDWQMAVFGVNLLDAGSSTGDSSDLNTEMDPKMVWGKLAIFTNIAKSKEKLKSDDFLAKNYNNVKFINGSAASGSGTKSGSWDNLSVKSQQIQNMSASMTGLGLGLKPMMSKSVSKLSLDDTKSMKAGHFMEKPDQDSDIEVLKKFERLLHEVGEDTDDDQILRSDGMARTPLEKYKPPDRLEYVPGFGMNKVETKQEILAIKDYLSEAFKDHNHALGVLASKISHCFYSSYGCWKIKPTPILSSHAMEEWESITRRVYLIVRHIFPGLPSKTEVIEGESVSFRFLLYPILLSEGIYSLLFVLYASKCSQRDEIYRRRLIICEKKTDMELAVFLKIEEKFYPIIRSRQIEEAIGCLKQLNNKYCPLEMLGLIQGMFKAIDEAKRETSGESFPLSSDDIIPIAIFMVIRANVQHLGAEISLLEELMGSDFDPIIRGYVGYCFTTLEASYHYILSDKFFA